jgi:hypothetical protein
MIAVALYGFHGAKSRYDAHRGDAVAEEVIVPLAEALWWSMSLDEALERGDSGYRPRRDHDHQGQHVRGARFARNRINHQLVLAIERSEGRRFPMTFPMQFHEFLWLPVERLPPGKADPTGQKQYERHLAGQPVRLTLHAAASWFATEQNVPTSRLSVERAPLAGEPPGQGLAHDGQAPT